MNFDGGRTATEPLAIITDFGLRRIRLPGRLRGQTGQQKVARRASAVIRVIRRDWQQTRQPPKVRHFGRCINVDEIAYRDLQPGEVIQAGDEWKQMEGGRACWQVYHHSQIGKMLSEFCYGKARRPYNITELMKQRDQAAHEYRLYREALTSEQAAHKATMANGLQACKERDEAEQALKMARASLEETRLAREFVIEERNEAERALSEERAAHVQVSKDRDRLIVELNECQQQRQHLQAALEELQRRRDAAEAGYQVNTLTVGEVVGNILSALEIAGHALESLADTGTNDEVAHWSGFIAAVQVVRKIKETAK